MTPIEPTLLARVQGAAAMPAPWANAIAAYSRTTYRRAVAGGLGVGLIVGGATSLLTNAVSHHRNDR